MNDRSVIAGDNAVCDQQEAAVLLGEEDLGKTRGQTADKEQDKEEEDDDAPPLKRTKTMADTAEVLDV